MEALHSSWCGAWCACYVSLLSLPVQGWRLSALDGQRQSLPRLEAEHRSSIHTTRYSLCIAVDNDDNGLLSRRGHNIHLDVTLPITYPRCFFEFGTRSRRKPMYFGACLNTRRLLSTNTFSSRLASLLLRW